jgi:DnaD/phage-associated family protein
MSQDQGEYKAAEGAIRVKDESNDRKYFVITPRIVRMLSRTPHDLMFWETVKDIAGDGGECILNTDQLAALCGMSTGKIWDCREYWMGLKFITGAKKKDDGYPQEVWHLSIPDIWKVNLEWCEKYPKIADRIAFKLSDKAFHGVKPSPHESKPSPHERKNILIKKNQASSLKDADIFEIYEKNIGAITPMIADALKDAEQEFDRSWIVDAMELAVKNNKRSWAYCLSILKRWKEEGKDDGKKPKSQAKAAKKTNGGRSALEKHLQQLENESEAM